MLFQVIVYLYTIQKPWFCSISDNFPPCFHDDNSTIVIPNNGTIPGTQASSKIINYLQNIANPIIGSCDMHNEEKDEEYYEEHYATVSLFLFSHFPLFLEINEKVRRPFLCEKAAVVKFDHCK